MVFAGLHVSMLNTAAMTVLHLLEGPPPPGVTVHRDETGEPTGVVTEIFSKLPEWQAELVAAAVSAHQEDRGRPLSVRRREVLRRQHRKRRAGRHH